MMNSLFYRRVATRGCSAGLVLLATLFAANGARAQAPSPGVVLFCEPPGGTTAQPFGTIEAEELRQDYACFLSEVQEVVVEMQRSPYAKGVLDGTLKRALRKSDAVGKEFNASDDPARALAEARQAVSLMTQDELAQLDKALMATPNWREMPSQMRRITSSAAVTRGLKAMATGTCPADTPLGVKDVIIAESVALVSQVARDALSAESFEVPNLARIGVAIASGALQAVALTLEGVHEAAGECDDTNFRAAAEATLRKLNDDTRYISDAERDAQTQTVLNTLKSHLTLRSQNSQSILLANAASNRSALQTVVTIGNEAQSLNLQNFVNANTGMSTQQVLTHIGTPAPDSSVLGDVKNNNNANLQLSFNAANKARGDLSIAVDATRNLVYANDNANAARALAELATRTERLRIAACETIRLTAINNGLSSECHSCADQPGFPYGSTAGRTASNTVPVAQPIKISQSAPTTLLHDEFIETQLKRNSPAPLLCLPVARGGRIEEVKALVWNYLQTLESIGSRNARAHEFAAQGDKAINLKQYVSAFEQYARAYQELTQALR